jgi:hypothetical protein
LAITILAFLNSFPGEYHFDDYPLVLENQRVINSKFDYTAFLENYGGRPLTFWSFWMNHRLFGNNPVSYHITSLLLHSGVILVLYFLVLQWRNDRILAFFTALIFAIHPSQAQAVNYIWSRSMLLMALFCLISLKWAKRYPWVSVVLFQVAIWSRFEAVIIAIPLSFINPKKATVYFSITTVNLLFLGIGIYLHKPVEFAWTHPDPFGYWLQALTALWWYLGHMIWPITYSIYRGGFSFAPLAEIVSGLAWLILIGFLWKFRKTNRAPVIAIAWTLLFLISSLIVPNAEVVNESRTYLAFAGIAFLAAWILVQGIYYLNRLIGFDKRLLPVLLAGALSILFLPVTHWRNSVWQESVLLWAEAIAANPNHFHAYYNLGSAYARNGQLEAAVQAFQESSRLNPNDDMSYAGLGYCCEMSQDWQCAARWYSIALSLNPGNQYAAQGMTRISGKIDSEGT